MPFYTSEGEVLPRKSIQSGPIGQYRRESVLSEYVEAFRSKVNEQEVRAAFPEMTDAETPVQIKFNT